ncbi:MAG: hypothetical protein MRY83_20365 [Flavobacteriales bacterium]|nr:hypothetical protein [Flavobacteriales bacterium]
MNKKTFKALTLFIDSPYFKVSENVKKLHNYLQHGSSLKTKINEKTTFSAIYPNQAYNKATMSYLLSDYNKTIERFLAHEKLEEQKQQSSLLTYQGLMDFASDNIILSKEKSIRKTLDQSSFSSNLTQITKEFERLTYAYHSSKKSLQINNSLQTLSHSIDQDFLYNKLKYSCELLTRKEVLSKKYDFTFLDSIVEYAEQNITKDSPLLFSYLKLIKLIKNPNDKDYYKIRDYLLEHHNQLPSFELKNMYIFIINYCIKKSNLGDESFRNELFENYNFLLSENIITLGGFLSLHEYKNISTIAILLKKLDWLNSFSARYTNFLEYQYRKTANAYNLARIFFQKGDYSESIKYLIEVDQDDLYYDLGKRILWVKIYFELDDFELFNANTNSFMTYLNRNKIISDYQRKLYKSFLKWIKRLYAIREGKRRNYSNWLSEIKNDSEIADKTWILESMISLK